MSIRQLACKDTGRVRWQLSLPRPRLSEIRWVGPSVQWVVSPVQVALWTDNRNRHAEKHLGLPYNWRFNWCPLPRDIPQPVTQAIA